MAARNFLITGTSRGIGLELTRVALEQGNKVYAVARQPKKSAELEALKDKYSKTLQVLEADVRDAEQLLRAKKAVGKEPIDVLVNNAGVYDDEDGQFAELDLEIVADTFTTNVLGPMTVTQTFLDNLTNSKTPMLVNITSQMGSISDNKSGGYYGYRISKAALNMFNKSFAVDFPKVTSLVLHPGWVQTDMGGSQAPVQPEESARGLMKVILAAGEKDSGKFLNYRGEELPW